MKKYLLLLILPLLSYASIGKVTVVKGDVTVNRDGLIIKAKSGVKLEKSDFIETKKNGKVQIVFTDNTIFTVGKSSTLDIADYLYDESKPKKNKAQFNVLKGAFSSITGRIGKLNKNKFKLKTKSASIGIRGTIIQANQETIMCTEGAITVTTHDGIVVRVESGYKTNVASGTPTKPAKITKSDLKQLDAEVNNSDDKSENKSDSETDKKKEKTADKSTSKASNNQVNKLSNIQQETTEQTITKETKTQVQDVIDARSLTLEGRTIDKDGNQQILTIDAQNIRGDLTIDGQDAIMTDNYGNKISSTTDETITWGHWADDPSKKWVAGKKTNVQVLDQLRNDSSSVNAEYSGQVMGSVNGADDIKIDSNNAVNINFELGGGKNTMDGDMKFNTEEGQAWSSQFGGTTTESNFNATSLSGESISKDDAQAITSGSVEGSFYGDDAKTVGGTFQLNTDVDKATGVFKATK